MIKDTELRKGNLVTVDDYCPDDSNHLLAENLIVVTVEHDKAYLQRSCGCCHEEVEYKHLSGLPLSREILIELELARKISRGTQPDCFTVSTVSYHITLNGFDITVRNLDGKWYVNFKNGWAHVGHMDGGKFISYAHELQNLVFAITGEELKINKA
jgi:hypothetical protein